MTPNSDLSKQAQEIMFSNEKFKKSRPSIIFITVPVACTTCHNHFDLNLDEEFL